MVPGAAAAVGWWCRPRAVLVLVGHGDGDLGRKRGEVGPARRREALPQAHGPLEEARTERADERLERGEAGRGGIGRAAHETEPRARERARGTAEAVEDAAPLLRDRVPERFFCRHEVHDLGQVDGAVQRHRVDVRVAVPQTEVQDGRVVIGAGPARGRDHVAALHGLTAPDCDRRDERVRRAQPAGMRDDDVQRACDRARERDFTRARGAYRRTRCRGEVDAEMAGRPLHNGLDERPRDRSGNGLHPHRFRGSGTYRSKHEQRQCTRTDDETAEHRTSPSATNTTRGSPGGIADTLTRRQPSRPG